MSNNRLIVHQPNTQLDFGAQLTQLSAATLVQATQMVEEQIEAAGSSVTITPREKRAMVVGQALNLVNAVDFTAEALRYELIRAARSENLASADPNQYSTLEEYAAAYGLNPSRLSCIIVLFEHVFPYIEANMHNADGSQMTAQNVWMNIGVTKLRELTSFFGLALGLPELEGRELRPDQRRRRENMENAVAADRLGVDLPGAMANADTLTTTMRRLTVERNTWTPEERTRRTMSFLMAAGSDHTWENLRQVLRPQAEANSTIDIVTMPDGTSYVIIPANQATLDSIQRKFQRAQLTYYDLSEDVSLIDDITFYNQTRNLRTGE